MASNLLEDQSLSLQAEIFAKYLIGKQPSRSAINLYKTVLLTNRLPVDERDKKLLLFALKHPLTLSYVDAYLSVFRPRSEVRRRVHTMFAILEAMPQYWDDFLPRKRSIFYWFIVALYGVRAVFRFFAGLVIVNVAELTKT